MRYWLAIVISLCLNAAANLLMKLGAQTAQSAGGLAQGGAAGTVRHLLSNVHLMAGLLCFGFNVVFYMYALQSRELKISVAYPIMVGGGFAIIAVAARFHPHLLERLTWMQWAGVGLVLLGIAVIAVDMNRLHPGAP